MILYLIKSYIFTPVGRIAAAVAGVLFTVWYIYAKGRAAARAELENKSFKEARNAIKKAEDARRSSDLKSDRGGLLDDDGYRRD
jgi:membrane protein DedA with SNARE-associated domain